MFKLILKPKFSIQHLKHLRAFSSAVKTEEPLFPHKDDFPSRHIGPRDRDIITMLDLLGFKVSHAIS